MTTPETEYGIQDNLTGEIVVSGLDSEADALRALTSSHLDYRQYTIVKRQKIWTTWFESFS